MDNDSNLNNNENYTNKPFYEENTNNPLGQGDHNIQNMNTNSENPYGQSNVVDNTGMYGQKNEGNQYNNNPDISGNKVYSVPTNSPVPESNSNLGIVSFILTILGCTALIGLILAIVDLTTKDGKKKTFSKISIGICAVWVLIFTINRVTTHNRHKKGSDYVVTTEATTELTTELTTEATTEATTERTTSVTTEATTEATTEVLSEDTAGTSTEKSTGSSDVREMLDAYEAFMNEYFDLLEKMAADPTDLNLIAEYGDLLQKEAEWTKKIDAMDEDEMSPEDAAYYLEVTGRIYKRLAEFGEN